MGKPLVKWSPAVKSWSFFAITIFVFWNWMTKTTFLLGSSLYQLPLCKHYIILLTLRMTVYKTDLILYPIWPESSDWAHKIIKKVVIMVTEWGRREPFSHKYESLYFFLITSIKALDYYWVSFTLQIWKQHAQSFIQAVSLQVWKVSHTCILFNNQQMASPLVAKKSDCVEVHIKRITSHLSHSCSEHFWRVYGVSRFSLIMKWYSLYNILLPFE